MPTQSFPAHLAGRQARPADAEATEGGTQINYATDRAAEVAAELGITAEDLGDLVGTGKEGAITVADVKNWGKEPDA
jgi:pyruvate/2-oxoglutarate dehydrogenase complex dihydrolipoamide acyltransferase (E2) component